MIKIYLDWNVMAQMKNGFHQELKEIVLNNDKLLIPYSTSHIGDIFSSFKENDEQNKLINEDLEFISALTNNLFLSNDGKVVTLDSASPKEYYQQKLEEKDFYKDLSIEWLFKGIADDEFINSLIQPYISILSQMPLDNVFKDAFSNPESSKQFEILFPGLKENLTMEGFFKSFSELYKGLNNNDKYKDLRDFIQKSLNINRDKLFDNHSPYELIEKSYNRIGLSPIQKLEYENVAPQWFNEITNEYILLDMHGYQEDKVNVDKGRKETFKNTTEDAFHAAFASTCNFYVVNDNKSYKKTKQVFKKLNINTVVFKPAEFIDYYKKYLDVIEPIQNIRLINKTLEQDAFIEQQIEDGLLRTYYLPYFLFDFFNKILVVIPNNSDPEIIVLSRIKPNNSRLYIFEIKNLVIKITSLLGPDIDNYGEVLEDEFKEEEWIGREWVIGTSIFRLVSTNGYIQLYIDRK